MLFICSSINGHSVVSAFWLLQTDAAVDVCVQVFVWTYVFISRGCIPRGGLAGSYSNSYV